MNTYSVMLEDKLTEYFRRLNEYATRAQMAIDMLPEFEWDIRITTFGDIEIYAKDIAGAHDALVLADFANRTGSDFYYKKSCIITLVDTR
jgi:hypothetical protein